MLLVWAGGMRYGGSDVMARTSQPPEGAVDFAAKQFRQIVEEVVFSSDPSDMGFHEGKESITFSELYPVFTLNVDFALGRSDDVISAGQVKWVAVIFQDGQPANAIGTELTTDGHYVLAALGYPPELTRGLLGLKDDEVLVHDVMADEYYVFSQSSKSFMKLNFTNGALGFSNPHSKEQLQRMLMERYMNAYGSIGDGKHRDASSPSRLSHAIIITVLIIVGVVGGWLYRKRVGSK